jgi:hypothetical protein
MNQLVSKIKIRERTDLFPDFLIDKMIKFSYIPSKSRDYGYSGKKTGNHQDDPGDG